MTRLATEELRADWIINSDADEFWVHPETSLKEALDEARSPHQVCRRRNMVYPFDAETSAPGSSGPSTVPRALSGDRA